MATLDGNNPVNNTPFPSHLIDPKQKGKDWIMQYCKAAWWSWNNESPRNIFYHNRWRYEEQKQYAMGNQSVSRYYPLMGVKDDTDETFMNISWDIIPIVPKFRAMVLNEMAKQDYNIVCTPIDSQANEETDKYFADARAKIMIREQAEQIDPNLLQTPALQLSPKEAKDLEELEMQMNFTYKHNMSIEAEQAIKLILEQNQIHKLRREVREDIYDHGVGGYKEYIDSNGAIKVRKVIPGSVISSLCRKKDFSDALHVGEIVEMTISDLKQMAGKQFTNDEYELIAKNVIGLWGNPNDVQPTTSTYNRGYDKFRIRVMDIEFHSVNDVVYENKISARGNKVYAPAPYDSVNPVDDDGNTINKYERTSYKVIYKAKWILNTDFIFDYGLCTNMKRAKSNLMDTTFSYHLYAPDFWDMKAYGVIEKVIPIADAIQLMWYRMQNAINMARPKGIMIEMSTLEDINLGKGGKKLTPMAVLDLFNSTGTLVYRKTDSAGRQGNVKPIEELENGLGRDVMNYWQLLQNQIQLLRDVTGLNELTDGSTPDPKTLTTIANLAARGTSNATYHISQADKWLVETLAEAVILRLQDVVKAKEVKGYVRGLGGNSVKFIQVNPALSLHEFGIMVEEKPTDEQRQMLMQQLANLGAQGLVEIEDAITIENTDNLKVAQQILAYKVKKRKQEIQKNALQQQQQTGQIQMQSAQAAEEAKQQTLQLEYQLKSQLISMEKQWDYKIAELQVQGKVQASAGADSARLAQKNIEKDGKENVEKIKQGLPTSPSMPPNGLGMPPLPPFGAKGQ